MPWRAAAPTVNFEDALPGLEISATRPDPRPTVDDVEFRSLYRKTKYVVETADGWSLVITRYRPVPDLPPAAVRRADAAGARLLAEPARLDQRAVREEPPLLRRGHPHPGAARTRQELRRSSRRSAPSGSARPLPPDIDYGWDIDSYFLYDLPAAVAGVKRITRRSGSSTAATPWAGCSATATPASTTTSKGSSPSAPPRTWARVPRRFALLAHGRAHGVACGGRRRSAPRTSTQGWGACGPRFASGVAGGEGGRRKRLGPGGAGRPRLHVRAGGRAAEAASSGRSARAEEPAVSSVSRAG